MTDVTATEAARNFADLLDAVERGGEFTIIRRGRAIAHLEPIRRGRGRAVKDVLAAHRPNAGWADDIAATRAVLVLDEHG